MAKWTVMPGISAGGGGGPVAGSIGQFIIDMGGKKLSAVFAGVGLAAGGPASFTYTDKNTTGYAGDLVVRGNGDPLLPLLKIPTDGLMLSIGTAPRHLVPGVPVKPDAVSGFYSMVIVFGVTSSTMAAGTVAADIWAKSNGWLLSGCYAYAVVGTLSKGVDLGGVAGLAGNWFFG